MIIVEHPHRTQSTLHSWPILKLKAEINQAADVERPLTPAPLPDRAGPAKTGRGRNPGGPLTQGSSFLATAGLICETRFGVFKMAGLQLGHPYGVVQ
jgi:hypothetical protein